MIVTVRWVVDSSDYDYGYQFIYNGQVLDTCEECEYHDTVRYLESLGYIVRE